MAETLNIGELAVDISNDVLSWFKWEVIDLYNENSICKKPYNISIKITIHPVRMKKRNLNSCSE